VAIGVLYIMSDVAMTVLSYPSLFEPSRSPLLSINNWDNQLTNAYLAYSLMFFIVVMVWAVYFFYLLIVTAAEFRKLVG
jgi:hypothetical protein